MRNILTKFFYFGNHDLLQVLVQPFELFYFFSLAINSSLKCRLSSALLWSGNSNASWELGGLAGEDLSPLSFVTLPLVPRFTSMARDFEPPLVWLHASWMRFFFCSRMRQSSSFGVYFLFFGGCIHLQVLSKNTTLNNANNKDLHTSGSSASST